MVQCLGYSLVQIGVGAVGLDELVGMAQTGPTKHVQRRGLVEGVEVAHHDDVSLGISLQDPLHQGDVPGRLGLATRLSGQFATRHGGEVIIEQVDCLISAYQVDRGGDDQRRATGEALRGRKGGSTLDRCLIGPDQEGYVNAAAVGALHEERLVAVAGDRILQD